MASLGVSGRGVYHIDIVFRPFGKYPGILLFAEHPGRLGQREVVKGVFKGARHLFTLVKSLFYAVLERNVAVFEIRPQGAASHAVLIVG